MESVPPPNVYITNVTAAPTTPSHLVFGRGLNIGGLPGLIIWFASVALWAYMWAVFTASVIYFVRSGFNIASTIKEVLWLAVYPIISIPMYLFVVLPYRFIYCPIHHWMVTSKIGKDVQAVEIAAEETFGIISFSPVKTVWNAGVAAWDLLTGKKQEELEAKVQAKQKPPKYCPGVSGVSEGCGPRRTPNPSIFSLEYWFCRDLSKGVTKYACDGNITVTPQGRIIIEHTGG